MYKLHFPNTRCANIQMSMIETASPCNKAIAERMNRTIKEEFCLNNKLLSNEVLTKVISESVEIYNSYRPHLSLKYYTPNDIHKNPQ